MRRETYSSQEDPRKRQAQHDGQQFRQSMPASDLGRGALYPSQVLANNVLDNYDSSSHTMNPVLRSRGVMTSGQASAAGSGMYYQQGGAPPCSRSHSSMPETHSSMALLSQYPPLGRNASHFSRNRGSSNPRQNVEGSRKKECFSILEALEQLEEQDDDEGIEGECDEEPLRTLEHGAPPIHHPPAPPLHLSLDSGPRHLPSRKEHALPRQAITSKSFTKSELKNADKQSDYKGDEIPWDMTAARRPPTTNFGGAAAARWAGGASISSSTVTEEVDEDTLLAIALQKEEDDYAAALRADRDRREEERRQLIIQLLEQVPNAPPPSSTPGDQEQVVTYEAPDNIDPDEESDFSFVNDSSWLTEDDICSICLDSLSNGLVVTLRQCNHLFHLDCLDDALEQCRRCPQCRQDIRTRHTGASPSGTMTISRPIIARTEAPNGTYLDKRVIQIEYVIPDGEQKAYHDRPGDPFKGTIKVAYLPSNSQGNYILKRLIFAFQHGMTFRLTRSLDGEKCVVNWASIPHRFSLGEKEFDAIYIGNCNDALDQLGVPTSFAGGST